MMRPLTLVIIAACAACHASVGGDSPAPSASATAPPASATAGAECDGGLGYGASCNGEGTGVGVPGKAHDPNALRVEASLVGTTSGLPGEVVIRIVRANLPLLRRCHKDAQLDGGAPPTGQVRIGFEIGAAGKTAKVQSAGSSLGSAATGCMTRVLEGLSFPAPERAPVTATIEVAVSPP